VTAIFSITIHEKDLELLKEIQGYFGGAGKISKNGERTYAFKIYKQNEIISKVLLHFSSYPLLTQKKADYLL